MNTQLHTAKDSGTKSGAEQLDPRLGEARADVAALHTSEVSVDELSRLANETAAPALGTAVTLDGIERARADARKQAELSTVEEAPQPGHAEVASILGTSLGKLRDVLLNTVNAE